jgi:virulence-associated protein VagC
MALIKKISVYGSSGSKCIVLSKEIRELVDIKEYISITVEDNKLIIEPTIKPVESIENKET